MPRGRAPTLICAICARRSKSITSSVSPSSALTYTVRPSGLKIACSGFCAFHFHRERFALQPRVDEADAVRLLARRRDPAAVGRAADAFGRDAERDRAGGLAFPEIDQDQTIVRLVAYVKPMAIPAHGGAARLAAGLQRVHHGIGCRVDDAEP